MFTFIKIYLIHLINNKRLLNILIIITSVIISVVVVWKSTFYRWFGYETIPIPITDEFNYTWQGLSIRSHGLPLGWVTFDYVYKNPSYKIRGGNLDGFGMTSGNTLIDLQKFKQDPRPIVAIEQIDYMKGIEHMFFAAPFFDHPPLGGLIYSLGEGPNIKKVDQVKPAEFRKPTLVMAIITSALLFIFLYVITSNPWIPTLGVIIYSTVPTYILATRTAFLENVEPPFILTHLILLFLGVQFYRKKFNRSFVFIIIALSGLFGGLGFLAKETAIGFVFGSIILLLINKVPKKLTFLFLFSVLIPILVYFSWGLWLQKDIFLAILYANANRGYFGALKPVTMLETLKLKNFPIDGWWFYGLLSFVLISLNIKNKNLLFLLFPLFTHYLVIMLMGSENYGWYLISMIPFLAGCSALAIWEVYENPTITTTYAFFLIAFSSSYYWGRVALNIQPSIMHYRWVFLMFTIFFLFRMLFGKYKFIKFVWFIFLAYLIYKCVIYNQVFLPHLVANWGRLPIPSASNF